MLSHQILTRQDVGRTASYYEDSADDYYAKEGEAKQWHGKGAEILGLTGDVDKQRFRELLAGRLGPGIHINRGATDAGSKARIGIDLTFSAPKSVSLQALVHGDPEIVKAHDRAVARTLEVVQEKAQARTQVDGKRRLERTGNIIAATFRHETSRERDPQLHTHAVLVNATQRSDGQWRALHNDEVIKSVKHLGAEYRTQLAHELQRLGYSIRHERDGMFELAHISRKQIEHFSQRGTQVEERLAERGKTRATASTKEKQLATMQTRAKKTATDRELLHREWKVRAAELSIDFGKREWAGEGSTSQAKGRSGGSGGVSPMLELSRDEAAKRAITYAVNHHTERQAVVSHKVLVNTAMQHAVGRVRLQDVEAEIKRRQSNGSLKKDDDRYVAVDKKRGDDVPRTRKEWEGILTEYGMGQRAAQQRVADAIKNGGLAKVDSHYTTQVHIEREKRILQIEREGRGAVPRAMAPEAARERLAGSSLNAGQQASAELIVTTENRVVGVQGSAGVGKSYMVNTAKSMLEEQGYRVFALAPYASQVKALRSEGVEARTVASFLRARDKGLDERTVVVLDEAGVIPTRQMDQALRLIEKAGARTVLLGDTEQTKAIEAGRPFDQLQKSGMDTAFMKEIRRQQNKDLRHAVEMAAEGRAGESVAHITAVHQVRDDKERYQALANTYVQHPQADRDETIIVTGTNEARREVNQRVRAGLELQGKGHVHDAMVRQDTTQAERRYSSNYQVGWYVQPERDYDKVGLKRGELYKVLDTGPGNYLTVEGKGGDPIRFSPARQSRLSAYAMERLELSPGDTIRINRHGAHLDLANGDRFRVGEVSESKVTLTSESRKVELPTDKPLHLDYAYATTVHSSQGLTADRVLIDAKTSSRTTSRDVYYVAISRARHEATMFTNDARRIAEAVQRENPKHAALDIVGHPTLGKHRERQQEAQREAGHGPGTRSVENERTRHDHEHAGQTPQVHQVEHAEQQRQRQREAAHDRDIG